MAESAHLVKAQHRNYFDHSVGIVWFPDLLKGQKIYFDCDWPRGGWGLGNVFLLVVLLIKPSVISGYISTKCYFFLAISLIYNFSLLTFESGLFNEVIVTDFQSSEIWHSDLPSK